MDADALDHALNEDSGMRGLAGGDGLELELERRAAQGDEAARLAVDVYVHRVAGAVAAMATAAGGLDVLVFTAGIGERSPHVRERVCDRLAFLGVELDGMRNAADGDRDIATAASRVRVAVIRAREELIAARVARRVIGRRG
jgi:acetate kinase